MAKSIKQLTRDLDLSRSAVETRMGKIPNFRKRYTQKHGNRVLINAVGCRLLSQNYQKYVPDHHKVIQISGHHAHLTKGRFDNQSQSLSKILEIQRQNSRHQYSIIQAESQTIHHLTRLLNQQQQLQLSLENENKTLRNQLKSIPDSSRRKVVNLNHVKHNSKVKAKWSKFRNFWRRFFGKS